MNTLQRWIQFNRLYLGKPKWDSGITPPELQDFVATRPAGRALDLGCGTGTNVQYLASHGWRATGVDFVPKAILAGRAKLKRARLSADLRVGDVTRLRELSTGFDLILDIGCYHCLSAERMVAYAAEVKRLLAPTGAYYLYVHFLAPGRTVGAAEADLLRFEPELRVRSRKDGTDTASGGKSAWVLFER